MSMVNLRPMIASARENKYAQGAFNSNAVAQVEALIEIHEILRSPCLVQGAEQANGFMGGAADFKNATLEEKKRGAQNLAKAVRSLAEKSDIPVCLHLDHGKSLEIVRAVIDAGYTSVMIDGSHLPYEKNVELTKEVVDYASKYNVSVEGELGVLAGVEDDVFSENSTYTNPMLVCDFFEKTGVDCLAISYGTMHGAVKGSNVKLRKEIVTASMENMRHSGIKGGLVSHGSSLVPRQIVEDIIKYGGSIENANGVPVEQLKGVIAEGICKINVDTDIRLASTRNVREYFVKNAKQQTNLNINGIWNVMCSHPSVIDPREWLVAMHETAMSGQLPNSDVEDIVKCIKRGVWEIVAQLIVHFGSANKAELVAQISQI